MNGLVSVSFRNHTIEEIVTATKNANLSCIEWGGDIHVPHGDVKKAKVAFKASRDANIFCSSYGSYFRLGISTDLNDVLKSSDALETNVIRVWAFNKNRQKTTDEEYKNLVKKTREVCQIARDKTLCLECHSDTITEDYLSSLAFLNDVSCENLKMFWQPNQHKSYEYNLSSAKALAPYVKNVHVFAWEGEKKFPLNYHENRWREYIKALNSTQNEKNFLLEFMHDDKIETLNQTAKELNSFF